MLYDTIHMIWLTDGLHVGLFCFRYTGNKQLMFCTVTMSSFAASLFTQNHYYTTNAIRSDQLCKGGHSSV